MFRSLDAGTTWALVCGGYLDPAEVGQEPIVTSPQSEDGDLLCSGQVCDVVILGVVAQAILPEKVEAVPYDGTEYCTMTVIVSHWPRQ